MSKKFVFGVGHRTQTELLTEFEPSFEGLSAYFRHTKLEIKRFLLPEIQGANRAYPFCNVCPVALSWRTLRIRDKRRAPWPSRPGNPSRTADTRPRSCHSQRSTGSRERGSENRKCTGFTRLLFPNFWKLDGKIRWYFLWILQTRHWRKTWNKMKHICINLVIITML